MAAWYILYPGGSCNLVVPKLNSFRCRFVPCAACDNTSPSPKSHLFCLTDQLRMASCSTWFLSCHLGRESPNRWAARELPKVGICSGIRGCNVTLPSGIYLLAFMHPSTCLPAPRDLKVVLLNYFLITALRSVALAGSFPDVLNQL